MTLVMNRKTYAGIGLAAAVIAVLSYSVVSIEENKNVANEVMLENNSSVLQTVQTMQLPNVSGRIDHMDIDVNGQRLFVAELENNSLDVLDLKEGKRIKSISGLNEPQGVAFIPDDNQIIVANGGDGTVQIFNSENYSLIKTIPLSSDADNMRYDPFQKLVYVGYGSGGLAIIDPLKDKLVGSIKLDGHPESFQISAEMHPKIFVNVPESNAIEVIDAQDRTIVAKWPDSDANGNYPMALDDASHRLFVAYREPSELQVIDTGTGKVTAKLAVNGDPDDIFYDVENKQIYVSGGQGFVDVISEQGNDYHAIAKIPTDIGARTSLFVPQLNRLYVAVPDYSGESAKIEVFETHKIT